jgi:hypothetical protein
MLQEIASSADKSGVGENLISESLLEFYAQEEPFSTISTCVVALFDLTSKFNRTFWLSRCKNKGEFFCHGLVLEIANFVNSSFPGGDESQFKNYSILAPELKTWSDTFKQLLGNFPEVLLASFGIKYDTFDAPDLRQQMALSGYMLNRSVVLLKKSNNIDGVAISFGLPTFANLTATANHLWLLLEEASQVPEMLESIAASNEFKSMLQGVTQVIVVTNRSNLDIASCKLDSRYGARLFGVISIPLIVIPEFLGVIDER